MFKKRLAGSALVLSLVIMTPCFAMENGENVEVVKKKNSIVKDIGAGVLSLGALAGAAYGLYWANDYDVKKTVKPFIGLAAIGSALTAFYLCAGKFILREKKKTFDNCMTENKDWITKKANDLENKLDDFKKKVLSGFEKLQRGIFFYSKRLNPKNILKTEDDIENQIFANELEESEKQYKKKGDVSFLDNTDNLNESVVVIEEEFQ